MVAVPGAAGNNIPVAGFTGATAVLPLVHVPPGLMFERPVAEPTHITVSPVLGADGLTVIVLSTGLHVAVVYDITVVPDSMPVATPVLAFIVADTVLLLIHVPPDVRLV
jgi:hypothetical protein